MAMATLSAVYTTVGLMMLSRERAASSLPRSVHEHAEQTPYADAAVGVAEVTTALTGQLTAQPAALPTVPPEEDIAQLECKAGITPGCERPAPFHQLRRRVKVAMCPNNHDHPWDNMIREGIHMHPLVDLIHSDRHKEADYIIHIADREEQMREEEGGRVCPGPFPKKTLVMDETDRPYLAIDESWQKDVEIADVSGPWHSYLRTKYLALFKRSFVEKDTSEPVKQLLGFRVPASTRPSQFPIQYPILQKFLREGSFPQWEQRKLDISTLLRDEFYEQDQPEGTVKTGARSIAQQWMQKYVDEHNITRYHRGTNDGDRGEADRGYFEVLWETKILVTCNPSFWEGDHRTGEALAAGAMTLVDVMWAPRQFPLISGWHAILYDASDEEDFMDKLHYYHTHDDEARKVAARGLYHAQRYFNTATFVDYVLITAEELTGRAAKHEYVRTGLQVLKDFNHMYDIQQRSIYPWRR